MFNSANLLCSKLDDDGSSVGDDDGDHIRINAETLYLAVSIGRICYGLYPSSGLPHCLLVWALSVILIPLFWTAFNRIVCAQGQDDLDLTPLMNLDAVYDLMEYLHSKCTHDAGADGGAGRAERTEIYFKMICFEHPFSLCFQWLISSEMLSNAAMFRLVLLHSF